jgi:predicted MFS family arabinose efflux permease
MLHQVGAFLGSWLGGVVLEATGGYDVMWQLDMLLAVLAAAISLTIPEQRGARHARSIAPAGLPPTSPARA